MPALAPNQQHRNARLVTTMVHARAAFASLAEHALPPSPPHYAIWFDHHGGARPELRAAIEEALARGPINEAIMEELGGRFFQPLPEFIALSAALTRLSGSLREALGVMTEHGTDAAAFGVALDQLSAEATHDPRRLHAILTRLTEEAHDMTRRSQEMGNKIAHSAQQIEALRAELEDTRREADTDALTGLPNRRSFDGQLRGLMAVGHENGQPLALLLIDIDHFKTVNDSFGHPVGDAVLRRTGATLSAAVRPGDVVARFGGEEFVVVLPATGFVAALEIGERMRAAVAAQSFTLRVSGTRLGAITASLGIAMQHEGEARASLLERADAALYRAKQEGRNRICTGQPAPGLPPSAAPATAALAATDQSSA